MIYLYIKTHTKTGLKYLGKTEQTDPHKYTGSGKVWKSHCAKHGFDYTTEILFQSENIQEIREQGIYYSNLWNIVESKEWANLTIEEGSGGAIAGSHTPEVNRKRSESLKGRILSDEHRRKLSEANKGHPDYRTPETKAEGSRKASAKLKGKKKPAGFGAKISALHKGKVMSKEAKIKMKSAWTEERKAVQAERTRLQNSSRPIITCIHCGLEGKNPGNMKRYHFDNCSKCLHQDLKINP
jgi:hypothetical protein